MAAVIVALLSNGQRHRLFAGVAWCLFFLVVVPMQKVSLGPIPLWVADVCLVLVLASACAHVAVRRGKVLFRRSPLDKIVLAFLILLLPSFFVSTYLSGVQVAVYVYARLAVAICSYFVARSLIRSSADLEQFVRFAAVWCVVASVFAIFQVVQTDLWIRCCGPVFYSESDTSAFTLWVNTESGTFDEQRSYKDFSTGVSVVERAYGGQQTPTTFGGMIAMLLPLVLYRVRHHNLWYVGAGLATTALVMSWTRHAFVAAVVAAAIGPLLRPSRAIAVKLIGATMVVGFFVLLSSAGGARRDEPAMTPWVRLTTLARPHQDTSMRTRIEGHGRLFAYLSERPSTLLVGSGHSYLARGEVHGFSSSNDIETVIAGFVSDSFLLPLYNFGVAAYIPFLALWCFVLQGVIAEFRHHSSTHTAARAIAVSIVATLILLLLDNYFHMVMSMQALMWFVVGAFVNARLFTVHRPESGAN